MFSCLKKITLLFVIFFSLNIYAQEERFDLDSIVANFKKNPQYTDINLINTQTGQTYQTVSRKYIFEVDSIRRKMSRVSGFHPKFLITTSSDINAAATWANGQGVTMYTMGLLRKIGTDYDALAAVVGHEYSHLTLAHHDSSETSTFIIDLLATIALAAIDVSYGGSANNSYRNVYKKGLNSLSNLTKSKISRDDEIEADIKGLEYMIAAGYSPEGAKRFHKSLNSSSGFFSTHPSSETRIAKIDEKILQYNSKKNSSSRLALLKKGVNSKDKKKNSNKAKGFKEVSNSSLDKETIAQACLKKGFKKNTSQYFACLFKTKRLKKQSAKIAKVTNKFSNQSNPNLPKKGQVGTVVILNSEKNTIIFSQSIQDKIPHGASLSVVDEKESFKYKAKSTGYYDGFYAAKLKKLNSINQGNRVLINTQKISLNYLKILDLNRDGRLTFNEVDKELVYMDEAQFNELDLNQDGTLNYAEAEDINIFILLS